MRLISALLSAAFVLASPAQAQDRMTLENRSALPWTLTLVEGLKPESGTLIVKDRTTSKPLGALARPGESMVLPPKGSFIAIFERNRGNLYQNIEFKDVNGHYAELLAHIEFLSNPVITVETVGHHVGSPLDRADEGAVLQFIEGAIDVGNDSIIIHFNTLDYQR
jgi:hypothetical protein